MGAVDQWPAGIGSWFLMFLEVFHWHHETTSLRLDYTPPPGVHGRGHPGRPLIAAWVRATAAPLVFLTATVFHRRQSVAAS